MEIVPVIPIPKVAVIGCGYWGKNLVRVFHSLNALAAVCDVSSHTLDKLKDTYGVAATNDISTVLDDSSISAVVIAAPAAQHYELTKRALLRGKDVYVEKPLALTVDEGTELVQVAKAQKRILMVGHILEYHPAIRELKKLVQSGELGKIQYIYSSRLNMGKLRTEENILWSFAPHDVSVILSLLNEMPATLSAQGGFYLHSGIADTTLTTCHFKSGVMAHIFVSWLHPFKEQKLCVIGDRAMAVFDDVEPEDKLVVYPHRVDWIDRVPVAKKEQGRVVALPKLEPLKEECEHFLNCIRHRSEPLTDGKSATQVLHVLEASERSLACEGRPVAVVRNSKPYFVHPSAFIDEPSRIGSGTKVWHFSHIMANCSIGDDCNLGQNVLVSSHCKLGNNVKVQNNVSIYTGVELEDDVFCGPSMVFTNVINPRSHVSRKAEYRRTLVKRGATLGANSTIICGVTIGEYAFIAAGAVITRDVPNYALMIGTPARQAGWMCYCGTKLAKEATSVCEACGRSYVISAGTCTPVNATERPLKATASCAD